MTKRGELMTELAASREYIPSTSDRLMERAQLVRSLGPQNPETLQYLFEYTDIVPTVAVEAQAGFSAREGDPRDKTPYTKAEIYRWPEGLFLGLAGRQVASGAEKFRQEYELRIPVKAGVMGELSYDRSRELFAEVQLKDGSGKLEEYLVYEPSQPLVVDQPVAVTTALQMFLYDLSYAKR
jgi:hypothetical protein